MTSTNAAPTPTAPQVTGLDPALAAINTRWQEAGIPDLYDGCLLPHGGPVSRERARNVRAVFYPKPQLPRGREENTVIDGRAYGVAADIRVRIVWPAAPQTPPRNTLVYCHGGGFVVGDLDSHSAHATRLANEAACVVVNVDYRLAPEHRFPAAYDDCLAAVRWAHDHIDRLGGDRKRLAVGGDSAGGNLAAAVAISCRDLHIPLAAQLLLYPATNLVKANGTPEKAYLGEDRVADLGLDPRASPALAATHMGVAPVILGVGPHDFLYADNLAYAQLLRNAQVPLTYREFPTLNHGFFSYTAISADSLQAAQLLCADLRAHFDQGSGA